MHDNVTIMDKVKVGVIGSTGYTGIELVRILNNHPKTEIIFLGANALYGKNLSTLLPNVKLERSEHQYSGLFV